MKFINRYLEGGVAPAGPAPAGAAPEENPMDALLQGAQLAIESQDCNVAMQVCLMLVELAGGGAPQGGSAPAPEGAPAPEELGEPVYRMGGRLVRRINKN